MVGKCKNKTTNVENCGLTIRSRGTRWFNPTRIVEHGGLTIWNRGKSWFNPTRTADNCGLSMRECKMVVNPNKNSWTWWFYQKCGLNQWKTEWGLKMVDFPKKMFFFFGSYVLNHHIWGRPIRQIHGVWWGFVQPQVLVEFGWRNAHVFIVRSTPRLDMVVSFWIPVSVGSPSLWHRCVVFRLCQHWCDGTMCSKIFGVMFETTHVFIYIYICVCIYIYICMYRRNIHSRIYVYTYIYICVNIYIYMCKYIYIFIWYELFLYRVIW
jgi:hypothetical protein